jgi:hypothetical protein
MYGEKPCISDAVKSCLSIEMGSSQVYFGFLLCHPTSQICIQEPFGSSPQSALDGAKLLIKAVNSVQLPSHHEWAAANPQLDDESGSQYLDRILQYASLLCSKSVIIN